MPLSLRALLALPLSTALLFSGTAAGAPLEPEPAETARTADPDDSWTQVGAESLQLSPEQVVATAAAPEDDVSRVVVMTAEDGTPQVHLAAPSVSARA